MTLRFARRALAGLAARTAAFRADRGGATAVEFAFVALPFMFMVFSILEVALIFMVSVTLDNATSDAAREIRTGAIQATGGGPTSTGAISFRNLICSKLGWLQNQCQANLTVDVRTLPQFSNPTPPSPVTNGVFSSSQLCFYSGNSGDIVLVRAFYQWTLLTPFLRGGLQPLNNGAKLLTSTATFRNEPYGGTPQTGSTC